MKFIVFLFLLCSCTEECRKKTHTPDDDCAPCKAVTIGGAMTIACTCERKP